MTIDALGWDDGWAAALAAVDGDVVPARVVRHDGVAVLVATREGERALPLRRSLETIVVGDWVAVSGDKLVSVLPRRSLLRRREAGGDDAQPMAGNVDQVLLACGVDRPFRPGRVRRGVAMAEDCGAEAIVVLTKVDSGVSSREVEATLAREAPGVLSFATSAREGTGLGALASALSGKTSVLVGESGAGKSSLVNALLADEVAAVGAVREADQKGRHTTTARRLHVLPGGGVLIDVPGMREAGLVAEEDAVDRSFDDVEALAAGCRFGDCAHGDEPGCAVKDAVARGELPEIRLRAWAALRREARASTTRDKKAEGKRLGKALRAVLLAKGRR